jgi:hypothetical protein
MSQQNGVLEYMNRALMERARIMLSGASLEKDFMVEVVPTTCYFIDMSPI